MNATLFKELSDAQTVVQIQAGESIADNFPGLDLSGRIILVNGLETAPEYIVQEGDIVMIRSVPHVISATVATIILIGVAIAAAGAAIWVGIEAYKLRKQVEEIEERMKNMADNVRNVPYLRGAANSIATGKSQPYLIGEHLFTPYLLTGTFSKLAGTDGADQYFHAVLENGFNSQVIRRLYCDDVSLKDWGDALTTPQEGIFSFDAGSVFYDADSLIEVSQDGNPFATTAFNKKIITESPGAQLRKADDADYEDLIYTLPQYTRAAEICIMFNGLRAYTDSGSKISRTVTVIPEYQLVDAGAWTPFTFDQNGTPSNTFTRNVMQQLRFVARIDLDYADVADLTDPVKVRLRCTTNEYDGSANDDVYAQWVQSEIYDPIASETLDNFVDEPIIGDNERDLSTMIGLKIKVSLSNQDKLGKINCISSGIARTWDGDEWSVGKVPTSNPAAWLLEVLTSHTHKASQADDSEIDLDTFGELYEYCETEGLAVDMVLTDGDTKEAVLSGILETCFSILYRDIYGQVSIATDAAKANAIALFNMQNVMSFDNDKSLARRTDGIKVSYVSRDGGYVQSSYLIMRSGVTRDADSILRDVSVSGIVEYEHIVKYARRLMAIEALRPKAVTVQIGKEGIYLTPLSKVLIQHPSLKVGMGSAEIKSVIDNGTHITGLVLYEPVEYDPDNVNGFGVVIAAVGDDYYTPLAAAYTAESERATEIEFVTPIALGAGVIPHPGDVLSYGTLVGGLFDLITTPMLIAGITPNEQGHSLTIVDYDENIYAVGDIPEYVPNFAGLKPTVSPAIPTVPPRASIDDVETAKEEALLIIPDLVPRNLGRIEAAHPGAYNNGDYWTVYDTDDDPIQRGVYWSNAGTPERITIASSVALQAKMADALVDVAWAEANGYGTSEDYGFSTLFVAIASVSALFTTLGAKTAFIESIFANEIEATGGIRVYDGQGVNKRCVQLKDGNVDWIDTPDPGTEQLRARIGRLGVGPILYDGEHLANIEAQWSVDTAINSAATGVGWIIQEVNGKLRCTYLRNADSYLVQRTSNDGGISWTAESVINGISTNRHAIIQQSDGTFRAIYRRASDVHLYQRTSADGITWAAETVVVGVEVVGFSFIQELDGKLRICYIRNGDNYLGQKTSNDDGNTWSDESLINGADSGTPNLLQQSSGKLRAIYRRNADGYIVHRTSDDGISWTSESEIISANSEQPAMAEQNNNALTIVYRKLPTAGLATRTSDDDGITWGGEVVISSTGDYPAIVQQLDGAIRVIYRRVGDNYLVQRTLQRYARIGAGIVSMGGDDLAGGGRWEKSSNGKLEQWGWGYVLGDGSNAFKQYTVEYPIAMASIQDLEVSCIGAKLTTNPATIHELVTATNAWAVANNITITNFIARVCSASALGSTARYGFSWHVIGTY